MFLVESWRLTISWAELESDHKPLQYIYNESSTLSAGIELWVFRLQGSNFKVIYSPSKTNITDALSRLNYVNQEDYSGKEADLDKKSQKRKLPLLPNDVYEGHFHHGHKMQEGTYVYSLKTPRYTYKKVLLS